MIKHIFYLAPLFGIMLLCYGCPADASKQQQETLAQLKEINAELKALVASQSTVVTAGHELTRTEKILAAVKPLPPDPTDAQITLYIDSVLVGTDNVYICGGYDPRIEYLRKIGPGHLAVLAPYLKTDGINELWEEALPALVADGDKTEAIKLLPRCPALAKIVVDKGWTNDAKAELFALAWYSDFRSYDLGQALRTFVTTPEDRQALTKLFLEKSGYDDFYPLVSSFAGADPKALALMVGQKHPDNGNVHGFERAVRAASFGNLDALESAVFFYFNAREHFVDEGSTILLAQTTGQVLNKKILRKWYEDNKDKLVFNAETRRFEVK